MTTVLADPTDFWGAIMSAANSDEQKAEAIIAHVEELKIDGTPNAGDVKDLLHTLNQCDDVHGVLVQTIRNAEIISTIIRL